MPSALALAATAIAVIYSFLRALVYLRHDSREPKPIFGAIPYLSPLFSMLIEQDKFYKRIRDKTRLPIYTLNIPGVPVYIANSLEVLQRVDRHIDTLPLAPMKAQTCKKVCSVSQAGLGKIYGNNLLAQDGYLYSHQRASAQAGAPGASLNALSRSASKVFAAAFDRVEARGRTAVDLYEFVHDAIFNGTTDAMYGPHNPFRTEKNLNHWAIFEAGLPMLFLGFLPNILARRAYKARERLVAAFIDYFGNDKHLDGGSLFVQLTNQVNDSTGLSLVDKARIEVGQVAAATFNTAPGAKEVMRLVDEVNGTHTIDLARVRTECPLLVSTLQEVMRFYGTATSLRLIYEDTMLDGEYLLKKGGAVLMPNSMFHTDETLWGPSVGEFDHTRFLKAGRRKSSTKHPAAAFRGFGGGHVLCPGRHLASTEMLALMALILVRVDVVPPGGEWPAAPIGLSAGRALPVPSKRVLVDFIPRAADKWRVIFTDKDNSGVNLVAEDMHGTNS
ncbi:cytochrome P450 [Daldinia caldariorum]|uniref:cytochrome P450 n=1 Tax=Daldinia caldariorum TaxID=326644 RepID=UPI00200875EF|nr:cytochrome P450 [Daldinia caldariorum]KAI1467618.1 cytochrome P450 [Daldinia caldariorum]